MSQVKGQVILLCSSTDKQSIALLQSLVQLAGAFFLSINCSVLIFYKFLSHKAQDFKVKSVEVGKLWFRMVDYQLVETGHVQNEIKNISVSGDVFFHPRFAVAG